MFDRSPLLPLAISVRGASRQRNAGTGETKLPDEVAVTCQE